MAVTVLDVAKRANVSATTVSLCFNGKSRISESTRKRVLEAAQELGYIRNQFARRLRLGMSRLIALIVPEIDTPFISDIVSTVQETLFSDNYNVLVFSTFRDCKLERKAVKSALELSVEGIIIASCEEDESLYLAPDGTCPTVFIDSLPKSSDQYVCVINDMTAIGNLGTEYLLRLGHQKILLINGPEEHKSFSSFKLFEEAYIATLNKHGIALDRRLIIYEDLYIKDGSKAVEKALSDNLEFSAVFAISDWVAFGAIQSLERHGFKVPDDVSVLGIDNISVSSLDRIGLTTIETYNPHAKDDSMGTTAAHMLLNAINPNNSSAKKEKIIAFKPQLVFRSSCKQHKLYPY